MSKLTSAPAVTPNYGPHKQQVMAFLRELLIRNHKPESAIQIYSVKGQPVLAVKCERCCHTLSVPTIGPIKLPFCGGREPKERAAS